MRSLWGSFRLQLQIVASDRGYLNEILTNPFFAIIFLGIVRAARRDDLTSFAIVAPVLITLWAMALEISGDIVDSDRGVGVLESVVASPAGFPVAVTGRVLAVTLLSSVAVVETGLVARLGFGVDLAVHHPLVAAATLAATALATAGTALLMAGLFVMARTARTFQNTMNFPVYLLAGVIVPISFLPAWIRPISRVLFLSWSADLLRASLSPGPVADLALRLGAIVGLGVAGAVAGRVALAAVLRRVRALGTLGYQ